MNAPTAYWMIAGSIEGQQQVFMETCLVANSNRRLVKVFWFGKTTELPQFQLLLFFGAGFEINIDRGRELNFADSDTRSMVLIDGFGLVFKHNRGMANVVADADKFSNEFAGGIVQKVLVEKSDNVVPSVEYASRFGLNAQADVSP